MKIIDAREIKIPENLPELFDARAGKKPGAFMDMLADSGKLREKEQFLIRMGLATYIKTVLTAEELPQKPMSIERLSDMFYAVGLAYSVGTFYFDDTGHLDIGKMEDIQFLAKLYGADKLRLRNGKTVGVMEFMSLLRSMCDPSQLDRVYKDALRGRFGAKKELDADTAYNLAGTAIAAAEHLAEMIS